MSFAMETTFWQTFAPSSFLSGQQKRQMKLLAVSCGLSSLHQSAGDLGEDK
jgi:hypothetical protein